jgi:hypothetical protein
MATLRGYYRQELMRAIDNLEWALTHIARVVEGYAEHHPEISERAREIGDIIVEVAELIKQLHDSI